MSRTSPIPTEDQTIYERRVRSLVNFLPVILWEVDAEGIVTLSEGRGLASLGFRPGELVGVSVFDLYKDQPELIANARRALAGEEFSVVSEVGGKTILEVRFTPKRDADGKLAGTVGVGFDVTERVRMEKAVQGVSRRLWAVLEDERRRISRELHDEAGQTMTALKLLLDRAVRTDDRDAERQLLAEAGNLCGNVLEELRRISFDLRPGALDVLGLRPSLQALVARFERASGVPAGLEAPESLPVMENDAQAAVYRFVQESLTNVARHARASRAGIRITSDGKWLMVEASDDGVGFVPSRALVGAGLGLIGMQERARMLGGRLVIDASPGKGTRIRLELPVPSPTAPPASTPTPGDLG